MTFNKHDCNALNDWKTVWKKQNKQQEEKERAWLIKVDLLPAVLWPVEGNASMIEVLRKENRHQDWDQILTFFLANHNKN